MLETQVDVSFTMLAFDNLNMLTHRHALLAIGSCVQAFSFTP